MLWIFSSPIRTKLSFAWHTSLYLARLRATLRTFRRKQDRTCRLGCTRSRSPPGGIGLRWCRGTAATVGCSGRWPLNRWRFRTLSAMGAGRLSYPWSLWPVRPWLRPVSKFLQLPGDGANHPSSSTLRARHWRSRRRWGPADHLRGGRLEVLKEVHALDSWPTLVRAVARSSLLWTSSSVSAESVEGLSGSLLRLEGVRGFCQRAPLEPSSHCAHNRSHVV